MKNSALLLLSIFLLLVAACSKKSGTTTPVNNPTTTTSPYYFKFKLDTASYDFNVNFPQYMFYNANVAGGFQVSTLLLYPSMALSFTWPAGDTVTESDVLGLAGKTLHYSDTTIQPGLMYDTSVSSPTWWASADTTNTNYSVTITSVTFLKKDTAVGIPVRAYVISGACTAVMQQGTANRILSGGSFNFVISRMDF